MSDKKYFWLKLKRDFFKRHDIRIIEAMPNGKDYILFYLKLLCESVDHEGNLRFSDQIPYSEEMLATITNTNIDIVRAAIHIFTHLEMMEILSDGTYFMNEVNRMIGFETEWARKKREYREKIGQSEDNVLPEADNVLPLSDKSKSKSKSIEKELEIDIDGKENIQKKTRFIPPTLEEVEAYCFERQNNVDPQKFIDHYSSNGWKVGRNPMKDWKAAVRTWERSAYDKPKINAYVGNPFTELKRQEGYI